MPYTIQGINDETAAAIWYHALTKSNPPEDRTFLFSEEFITEVQNLNMDVFDELKANELKEKYSVCKRGIKVQIDAEDIELAEETD